MKITAAISMRATTHSAYFEPQDSLSHDWLKLLQRFGVIPVLIPNTLENPVEYARIMGVNALLLTGGGDVSPQNDEKFCLSAEQTELELRRDQTENSLLVWALKARIPVLGICRGMHALNVFLGGSLCRDLKATKRMHVNNSHQVSLSKTLATQRKAKNIWVNSYHNTGIDETNIAPNTQVTAQSADGVIEAFEHDSAPMAAIQWHPERADSDTLTDEIIINKWISAAGRLEHQ